MKSKLFLKGPFFADHGENRMESEGDTAKARKDFIKSRFRNLDYLLQTRFCWMNDWIKEESKVIEVGAGAGFSEFYLNQKPILTDAAENDWTESYLDATDMDLKNESVDCIIASHNIHHFYSPYKFFKECERVLKPGGLILIQEVNTSLIMRFLLQLMKHEGWNYDVDVFDPEAIVNNPSDLWSANCAVPELIFEQSEKFEQTFEKLQITHNKKSECFIFPISGGVISKTKVPELPFWLLKLVGLFDTLLTSLLPSIFAMGRSVVIQKKT